MKIIGTAEDADRLLEVLMHIVPYINEVTKQMKSAAGLFAESCRDEECQQIMEVLGKVDYTLWNALDDITALREILSDYRDILAAGQENPTVAEQSSLGSPGQPDRMKPQGKYPRDFPVSAYGYHQTANGQQVYDSPEEMSGYLYRSQGSADSRFKGTCGLCSCANILRLAGAEYSEKEMIAYAAANYDGQGRRLCDAGSLFPGANGATTPKARKEILEHFGISSSVFPVTMEHGMATGETMEQIGKYVSEGRGVILSVYSGELNPEKYRWNNGPHAVTVVSVTKDTSGKICGYHICDSNYGTDYYDVDRIRKALTGNDMNVTTQIIR